MKRAASDVTQKIASDKSMEETKTRFAIPWKLTLLFVLIYLIFSTDPLIEQSNTLNAENAQDAKRAAGLIIKPLMSDNNDVEIELSASDLSAISDALTYTIPSISFQVNTSSFGLVAAATVELKSNLVYLNFKCFIMPEKRVNRLSDCSIGSIPIPSQLAYFFAKKLTGMLLGDLAEDTFEIAMNALRFNEDAVTLSFVKSPNLQSSLKNRVRNNISSINDIRRIVGPQRSNIEYYLENLTQLTSSNENKVTIADAVRQVFQLAKERSEDLSPVEENKNALWSLAIFFGNPDFRKLINADESNIPNKLPNLTLRGRKDIRLHFFYSVALTLMGNKGLSDNIGKYKELLDTNTDRGGTGYSFADLLADRSGTELVVFSTLSNESARQTQQVLSRASNDSFYIPYLHDLPEGLSKNRYKILFNNSESSRLFQMLSELIDKRIKELPYYNAEHMPPPKNSTKKREYNFTKNSKWVTVDTHIHTKHSDGSNSISEIAEKASTYGCDAIAITDHGDRNFKSLFTEDYFSQIAKAEFENPGLTIIPSLEWNTPPFRGREHSTVLLPKDRNLNRNLGLFRKQFDNLGSGFTPYTLSIGPALEWLEARYTDNIAPVIFYNHPSRKDLSKFENYHDFKVANAYSTFVKGFSGAPGHQKKRGSNNGSYDTLFRTKNGWDPSAHKNGDWDKLLSEGYLVYAARAPSDFHNRGMDYWPCQFSTTHVNVKSNAHNDILSSFYHGQFWAQQGKFVKNILPQILIRNKPISNIYGGEMSPPAGTEKIIASLDVTLNDKDWQGNPTSLDEIVLAISDASGTRYKSWLITDESKRKSFSHEIEISSSFKTVRWYGRSIQPELHHYLFMTNPIKVSLPNE